jgi:hypothetical protein
MHCELPTFYSHSEPIAKVRHSCVECDAPIIPGERYFRCAGSWNREFQTHCQHLECMEASILIRDQLNDGECIAFGDLKEHYRTELDWQVGDDKTKEPWKRLRHLMAVILWRERKRK